MVEYIISVDLIVINDLFVDDEYIDFFEELVVILGESDKI